MDIETAVRMLRKEYECAEKDPIVRKPIAYALYKVWRETDATEKDRKEENAGSGCAVRRCTKKGPDDAGASPCAVRESYAPRCARGPCGSAPRCARGPRDRPYR